MKFINVQYFFLIWVLPALALAYWYGWRRRGNILNRFAAPSAQNHIVPLGMKGRRRLKAMLVLTAMGMLVVAMAGPQYGFRWQRVERRGIDIILVLDCSRSMLATDIQPTRLDRAKREIHDLLAMLQGDRVGLVAFSGTAFLQCPLTMDYGAFNLFLDVLSPDYLPVGGTDLGAALQTAQSAFDAKGKADRAMILITDGENTGPKDPMDVVQAAQKAGIKLYCIGVGSTDGVPVPKTQGGFEKDTQGQIVLSRLDPGLLSRMALASGGTYVQSVAGDMDLETIYHDHIRSQLDGATLESRRKQVWSDRFQWPLALAVMLLLWVLWLPTAKGVISMLTIPLIALTMVSSARAGPLQQGYQNYTQGDYDKALQNFIQGQLDAPNDPAVLYNLGNIYYKKGDFGAAGDHYGQALSGADDQLKPKLLYNLGNSAYRQGRLKEAIQHYEAALTMMPDDEQAKDNLAFVKKQLQQQKQQQQQQENNTGRQSKDKPKPQQGQPQGEGGHQKPQSQGSNTRESSHQEPSNHGSEMNPSPLEKPQASDQDEQPAEQTSPSRKKDNPVPVDKSAAAQMLNRLKDQPGKAMMPAYQKRPVDKDW